MARSEQPREDLLREATALVERAELQVAGHDQPVVIGFRPDGAASIFLGDDPVFQFNAGGQLRRAYRQGRLIKAERDGLVALQRHREADRVELRRHELTGDETTDLLRDVGRHRLRLRQALQAGTYTLIGQVPEGVDLTGRIESWLASLSDPIAIADRPGVG